MQIPELALSGRQPVAYGKTRAVYVHPDNPAVLIKVHRPIDLSDQQALVRWFNRKQDWFLYRSGILRELEQFVASRYGAEQNPLKPFIAPIYGVVDTDMGLGFSVAAVRSASGELAPTIKQLRQTGEMTLQRAASLNRFFDCLLATNLVVGDLNQENIVLSEAGSDQEKFMIIDGLGERTLIPIQSWCPWASRRQKRTFVIKMRRRLRADGLLD